MKKDCLIKLNIFLKMQKELNEIKWDESLYQQMESYSSRKKIIKFKMNVIRRNLLDLV